MKRNISVLTQCANCGGCYNVCPVHAIRVNTEELFYRPAVKEDLCVNCGKCLQVCPMMKELPQTEVRQAFWGWHRDRNVVKASSSGGAFAALAEGFLENSGVVFAACFDEQKQVRIRSTDSLPLKEFQKSKYVESLVGNSFWEAREQLLAGRNVLFCGAPCQIAGLKQFLGKDYTNLYTCDFSCGGFSSHKIYREYLQLLENTYGAPVKNVDFRPKCYGWSTHGIKVCFANGKEYTNTGILDPYFYSFLYLPVNKREYCYQCKFTKRHASDIILADFWRYKQLIGGKTPETGVSLILVCTEKGQQLVQQLHRNMTLKEISPEEASYNLCDRNRDEAIMGKREQYLRCCEAHGVRTAAEKFGMPISWRAAWIRCKHTVKGVLLRFL